PPCPLKTSGEKAKKLSWSHWIWLRLRGCLRSLQGLSCRLRLPDDLIPQVLETLDQLTLHLLAIRLVDKLLAFLVILLPSDHNLTVDHRTIRPPREGGFFTPPPLFQAKVSLAQIRFGATHAMGGLDQGCPHRAISSRTLVR